MSIGTQSRVPALVSVLEEVAERADDSTIKTIIERAADPGDFVDEATKHAAVISYLNRYLVHDGLEMRFEGGVVRLVQAGRTSAVVDSLADVLSTISFDTVRRDLDRALASADSDPEDAITSACSTLESLCRSILAELALTLPDRRDLQELYRAIREPLGLSPAGNLPSEVATDVRTILSGLITTVQGIGALRTHSGDAHGRERGFDRVEPRLARLAIHAASTVSLFIIETWQRRFPARPLPSR
jgi:hypothetical protein